MIVAISYHPGDKPLMERWSRHVKKLGPYLNHEIIVSPSHGASTEGVVDVLKTCFRNVHVVVASHSERGWPISCNRSFQNICWHSMLSTKKPFLFMEPDAIPLKEGWIDAIENEYNQCGRPFMGDFVDLSSVMTGGIDHMSGIGVYTNNLSSVSRLFNCVSVIKTPQGDKEEEYAWDIFAASQIVPNMHRTKLIQHDWRGSGDKTHQWRKENVDPSFVNQEAVIYHPDKRGVLMNDGLAGGATRAGGELRTGAPVSVSSFEQAPPAQPKEEKVSGIKDQDWDDINEALSILKRNYEKNPRLKKIIKDQIVELGWGRKHKKTKLPRKKIRSSLACNKGSAAAN